MQTTFTHYELLMPQGLSDAFVRPRPRIGSADDLSDSVIAVTIVLAASARDTGSPAPVVQRVTQSIKRHVV
ncbi:hypothetical protein BH11VER1_BH11VER1_07920 [soil metagenome]